MNKEAETYMLPRGWFWATLDDVTYKITDGSHNPPDKEAFGTPMLSAKNIINDNIDFDNGVRYISEEAFDYENRRTNIESGDVLLTIVGSIGRAAVVPQHLNQKFAIQRSIALIKPCIVPGKFMMYALQAPFFQNRLEKEAKGTAQKGVYLATLKSLPIPIPPLNEQYKIVSRIEELNSALDDSEKSLIKVKRHLKTYKNALLKSAFKGKLRNKMNATWKYTSLGEVYSFIGGGTPSKKEPSYWNGKIKWASVKDINTTYLTETADSITENGLKNSSTKLAQIDEVILISRINPGKVAIAKSEIAINQDLKIIRPLKGNEINNKFTYYLFLYIENQIIKLSKGTTVKGIRVEELNSIKIAYPDIITQGFLVSELDKQYSLVDDLFLSAESCLKKIDIYRHVILQKAFKGELIQNDFEDSTLDLIDNIKTEKKQYKKTLNVIKQQAPKLKVIKKSLLKILIEEFHDKTFSITDIKNKIKLSDKELKSELFKLLDNKDIYSFFDDTTKMRLYKLKQ